MDNRQQRASDYVDYTVNLLLIGGQRRTSLYSWICEINDAPYYGGLHSVSSVVGSALKNEQSKKCCHQGILHHKFWALKWSAKIFSVPQTRRQVSATDYINFNIQFLPIHVGLS